MALKRSKIGMHSAHHVGPNMTPMVDVVMVILIFFMLGSSFTSPRLVFDQQYSRHPGWLQ